MPASACSSGSWFSADARPSQRSKPTVGQLAGLFNTAGYKVFDIYGSYSFSDSAKLRLAINNVTDEQYAPALGAFYYPAPGRTATVSLNFKF